MNTFMLITMADIARTVAAKFLLTQEELMRPDKCHRVAHPRQILMLIAREDGARSYPQIARYLDLDHTSVLYGHRKATARAKADPRYAAAIASCRDMLAAKAGRRAAAAESIRKHGISAA